MCDILSEPCKNGGHCQPAGQSFRCCCALGYAGDSCLQRENLNEEGPETEAFSVAFAGDGFAAFDSKLLPHEAVDEHEVIRISFSTTGSEGLLFYHGVKQGQDPFGRDYLVLAVVDGFLEFSWELGSGPAQVKSALPVNDGHAHRVVLLRKGLVGSMQLDDFSPRAGQSAGSLTMLNVEGDIYVGGVPEAAMTGDRYAGAFSGCIFDLEIQASDLVSFDRRFVKTACNLKACSRQVNSSNGGNRGARSPGTAFSR